MATWPHSGDWGGLRIDELPEVLAALCCAVNEREKALTIDDTPSYTTWNVSTENTTFPDASDFEGLAIVGSTNPISTALLGNLTKLNSAVSGMRSKYVTGSDSTTLVDYSTVISDWGDFTSDAPVNWRDHRVWCRCRDALKKMRYRKYSLTGTANSHSYQGTDADAVSYPYGWPAPALGGDGTKNSGSDKDWTQALGGRQTWMSVHMAAWWTYQNFNDTYYASTPYVTESVQWAAIQKGGCSVTWEFSILDEAVNGDIKTVKGNITAYGYNLVNAYTAKEDYGNTSVSASSGTTVHSFSFPTWTGTTDRTWSLAQTSTLPSGGVWLEQYPFSITSESNSFRTQYYGGAGTGRITIDTEMNVWFDQASVLTDL